MNIIEKVELLPCQIHHGQTGNTPNRMASDYTVERMFAEVDALSHI